MFVFTRNSKLSRKIQILIIIITSITYLVHSRMKIVDCGLYDAEFSVRKQNYRFLRNVTQRFQAGGGLRQCVTGCAIDRHCFSINFNTNSMTCEFVNTTTAGFRRRNTEYLVLQNGWDFFETRDKKSLGEWCSRNNPCTETQRCEDRCYGNHKCINTENDLRVVMGTAWQSSTFENMTAEKAIDGKHYHSGWSGFLSTCIHTSDHVIPSWWKVEFRRRVAINYIHFYNRLDCCQDRSNDLSVYALLIHNNGATTQQFCAITGNMEKVDDKKVYCGIKELPADQLMIVKYRGGDKSLSFCEVKVYGYEL